MFVLNTVHEVLGVDSDTARIELVGAKGILFAVWRGDVIVIPAGVAYHNLGSSPDFRVVGAYPASQR